MKGTKKYGNKIFIITENQTNALREKLIWLIIKKTVIDVAAMTDEI